MSTPILQRIVSNINEEIIKGIMSVELSTVSSHYTALDTARCILEEAIALGGREDFDRVARDRIWSDSINPRDREAQYSHEPAGPTPISDAEAAELLKVWRAAQQSSP